MKLSPLEPCRNLQVKEGKAIMAKKGIVGSVVLAMLSIFVISANANSGIAEQDYFRRSVLPQLPGKAAIDYAWRNPDGLVAVQANKLFFLKDGAEAWAGMPGDPPVLPSAAMTTSAGGKLHVMDTTESYTLELVDGKIVRQELGALPVAISKGMVLASGGKVYAAGLDANGSNVFSCGSDKLEAWSSDRAARVLMAQSQGRIYVFADEDGAGTLTAYEYDPGKRAWRSLSTSKTEVNADRAYACGDAHILFVGKGNQRLGGFYITLKQWVQFNADALPQDDFELLSDPKAFTILTPGVSSTYAAVLPGTKYGIWDHMIVAAFFILMLWVGKFLSKREKSEDDFFRGGQRLPWWAVGLSLFATGASAISLMAMPAKAYTDNWIYFLGGPIQMLFLPVVFAVAIPIARRLNFPSAYQYLEARYCKAVRIFGGVAFCVTQVLGRMAAIMVLPAIAMSAICGIPIEVSILIMGVVTTIYSMMGGFEAVVWTDCIQAFVMLGAILLCVVWVFLSLDVPGSEAWALVMSENKLVMADFSWDVTQPIISIIILGTALGAIGGIGDQNFIQRVQALPSEKEARKAVATQLFVAVPLNACLFALGTCLFVFYHYHAEKICPAMKADGIFPLFAAQNLPTGMAGIVVAALMAATMSTLSSALNSVSNVVVEDYVRPLSKDLKDHQALVWGKVLTVVIGVIGTGLSLVLARANSTSIWDMTMVIMGVFFSPLGSMFLLGVLTTRVHTGGIIAGFLTGIGTTLYCNYNLSLHPFFFSVLGLVPSMAVAYLVSVIFPRRTPRDLAGLTIFSLPPKPETTGRQP